MGREGFEPPKRFRSGFTARPIWPLWYLPALQNISPILKGRFFRPLIYPLDDPLLNNAPVAVAKPAKGLEPLTR
jgi:hypothetical protein